MQTEGDREQSIVVNIWTYSSLYSALGLECIVAGGGAPAPPRGGGRCGGEGVCV
jgi:hypothetical protein